MWFVRFNRTQTLTHAHTYTLTKINRTTISGKAFFEILVDIHKYLGHRITVPTISYH